MGKTAFGLSLARQAAIDGEPVLFCSLEMGHLELTQRQIAQHVQSQRPQDRRWQPLERGLLPRVTRRR